MEMLFGKCVCVGRNYVEYVCELGNDVFEEFLLFMKLVIVLCSLYELLVLFQGQGLVYYEVEMVVMIGECLSGEIDLEIICFVIVVYGVGLDLILCDLQSWLKEKGYFWEWVKGFDGGVLVFGFIDVCGILVWQNLEVFLEVNGESC